jgi:hypothetical protein
MKTRGMKRLYYPEFHVKENVDIYFCDICGKETWTDSSVECTESELKQNTKFTHYPEKRRALVCIDCYDANRDFSIHRLVAGLGWCRECRRSIGSGGGTCPYCGYVN